MGESKSLVKSIFNEMFGNPITNSKNLKVDSFIKIIKLQRGFDLPVNERNENGNYPVIGSNGILGKHNLFKCPKGIVTGRSGTIGEVQVYESPFWPLNTTLFSLDTYDNDLIYLKYLLSYFKLERFKEGSGVPTLNRNILHNVKIIDVPNSHQKKFSDIVLLIDKLKLIAQQILEKIELLKKALFNEMFGDPIIKKKCWNKVSISDCANVYNGRAYKQYELKNDGKFPILRVGNLFSNKDWYYSDLELDSNKYCEAGDLLYAWSASFGPVIWKGSKVIYHYHIWKIELRNNLFLKDFLYYLLKLETKIFLKDTHGIAMMHLTKEKFENTKLICPPLKLQQKFTQQTKKLDKLKANIEQILKILE